MSPHWGVSREFLPPTCSPLCAGAGGIAVLWAAVSCCDLLQSVSAPRVLRMGNHRFLSMVKSFGSDKWEVWLVPPSANLWLPYINQRFFSPP